MASVDCCWRRSVSGLSLNFAPRKGAKYYQDNIFGNADWREYYPDNNFVA